VVRSAGNMYKRGSACIDNKRSYRIYLIPNLDTEETYYFPGNGVFPLYVLPCEFRLPLIRSLLPCITYRMSFVNSLAERVEVNDVDIYLLTTGMYNVVNVNTCNSEILRLRVNKLFLFYFFKRKIFRWQCIF